MAYTRKNVWRHYDDTGCASPEPDDDDAEIMLSAIIKGERVNYTEGAVMGFEMLEFLIEPQVLMPQPIELLLSDEDLESM